MGASRAVLLGVKGRLSRYLRSHKPLHFVLIPTGIWFAAKLSSASIVAQPPDPFPATPPLRSDHRATLTKVLHPILAKPSQQEETLTTGLLHPCVAAYPSNPLSSLRTLLACTTSAAPPSDPSDSLATLLTL